MASSAQTAQKKWELENNVKTTTNEHYSFDPEQMKQLYKTKPWKSNPRFFTSVKMSALALIKIVMHAQTGRGKRSTFKKGQGTLAADDLVSDWIEVMGMLQGYYAGNGTFVVTDSFAIPADASAVEVSMNSDSEVYIINYIESCGKLQKKEAVVGWYHSHPGYSCYLSGTDVNTQLNNQMNQDPFLAIVIDPVRTISTGKVEVKAFRTLPVDAQTEGTSGAQLEGWDTDSLPQDKVKELGAHFHRYYELPITVFRSETDAVELDLLWNKYWMKTLSSSPLVGNRLFTDNQLKSVTQKFDRSEQSQAMYRRGGGRGRPDIVPETSSSLSKSVAAVSNEFLQGLISLNVKKTLFNPASSTSK
jgi:COP9 signalosome complex subunit 5